MTHLPARPLPLLALAATCTALSIGCGSSTSFTSGSGDTTAGKSSAGAGNATTGSGNAGSGNSTYGGGSANGGSSSGGSPVVGGAGSHPVIDGSCQTLADCVAVVDTTQACNCGAPVGASKADLAANRCLVPWIPGQNTQSPPGCVAPTNVMCGACYPPEPCMDLECYSGKCSIQSALDLHTCNVGGAPATGGATGTGNAGSGNAGNAGSGNAANAGSGNAGAAGSGNTANAGAGNAGAAGSGKGGSGVAGAGGAQCATLQSNYVTALSAAQKCDNSLGRSPCGGLLANTCGCQVAYDNLGPYGKPAEDAYAAWKGAGCQVMACGAMCLAGTVSMCSTTSGSTLGTCTRVVTP